MKAGYVIYIEGISCSGKTDLVTKLGEKLNDSSVVHELSNISLGAPITTQLCRINDEKKASLSHTRAKTKRYVISDRSYVSTLVYSFIEDKITRSGIYNETLNWYLSSIVCGKLTQPDLFIYMNIPSNIALSRAEDLGREVEKYAWYQQPDEALRYYDFYFKYLAPGVSLINLNGENPVEVNSELVLSYLSNI